MSTNFATHTQEDMKILFKQAKNTPHYGSMYEQEQQISNSAQVDWMLMLRLTQLRHNFVIQQRSLASGLPETCIRERQRK